MEPAIDRTSSDAPAITAAGVVWRVLLGAVLVPPCLAGAAVAAFIGLIEQEGCFIECREKQPHTATALLLYGLALLAVAVPPAVMALVWPRRLLAAAATIGAMVVAVVVLASWFGHG